MMKWCLAIVAVLGCYTLLGAQEPGGGGPGGGNLAIPCGSPPQTITHLGASATGTATTAIMACWWARHNLANGIALEKCGRCDAEDTFPCGGYGLTEYESSSGPAVFDPALLLWTCVATTPPGTFCLECKACIE